MTVRKILTALLAGWGLLVLILDGQTGLHGASAGIELCLKTVIPSLFPFLFLCSLLTASLWGGEFIWLRPIAKRLGIPGGAESLLVAAILGGYPAGAQAIGESFRENRLSKQDARHLMTFCNNAGPAFLFGMTAVQFPDRTAVWALWAIQILSSFLTGMLDAYSTESKTLLPSKSISLPQILAQTVKTMSLICGWILLFQILTGFLTRWIFWLFPTEVQVIITGLLELSGGCCALRDISDIPLRFLVCTLFLSCGGVCVTMQTASVVGALSLKSYLRGKLIHTAISLVLAGLYLHLGWMVLAVIAILILLFPAGMKNRGRFPVSSGV